MCWLTVTCSGDLMSRHSPLLHPNQITALFRSVCTKLFDYLLIFTTTILTPSCQNLLHSRMKPLISKRDRHMYVGQVTKQAPHLVTKGFTWGGELEYQTMRAIVFCCYTVDFIIKQYKECYSVIGTKIYLYFFIGPLLTCVPPLWGLFTDKI